MSRSPDQRRLCFQPRTSPSIRLLCLPHAGAGTSLFRGWGARLPAWVEVHALALPGREGRRSEPFCRDLGRLVDDLADSCYPLTGAPYALYGHSMGALLAFELARLLEHTAPRAPVHVFLAGYGAPHVYRTRTRMHLLPDEELVGELRRTRAAPEPVLRERELMALLLPILRADLALCATHEGEDAASQPLAVAVSAFAGIGDEMVPTDAVARWAELTTGPFRLRTLPGGHFFPAHAQTDLLAAIRRDLGAYECAA